MCEQRTPPVITRYEAVEITINAGPAGGQVAVPDVPNLRNTLAQQVTILDIEVMAVNAYAASFLNPAIPGMPIAEIPKIALVLYNENEESIKAIPLAKIQYTQTEASGIAFQQERTSFNNLKDVVWPKCYFKFNQALVGVPYIIPLLVTYTKVGLSPTNQPYRNS